MAHMKLSQLLPQWTVNILRVSRVSISYFVETLHWAIFDTTKSSILPNKTSDLADLMIKSHVLEKGITMPNPRLGFGYDRVRGLIDSISRAIKNYPSSSIEIQSALMDLEQYLQIHETADFNLPSDISIGIKQLLKNKLYNTAVCFDTSSSDFFSPTKDFREFALQRHSVRWYDKNSTIDKKTLMQVIQVAQTAPSACNRQSTRIYVIEDDEKKQAVLDIQNGNRGFGFLADKILLLTADMRYWNYKYRTSAYLDTGIFCMNLLYALHYYKIGACTLNAHLDFKQRKALRVLLGYSKAEIPVVFIAIGKVPQKFMICGSQRLKTENICKFI